ncbi:uncharacterized protein LOC141698485 [Apium graveolens]|uniref:uncharacterized protein LOC141698485 n=1 Tax=Apium graveolens TaxID=4045 RepID=UPI003D7AB27A
MAKREMSSTLKNLKFMQRATQREEISKKVEEEVVVVPDGNFPASSIPRKCVVIVEGDPHPGATRGRMSFLSFNPSVDKLNGEAANTQQPEGSSTTSSNHGGISNRENGSGQGGSETLKIDGNDSNSSEDLKRKYAEVTPEVSNPDESPHNNRRDQAPTPHGRNFNKQQKRGKLDWNVLRPPKPQNRRG